MLKQICNMTKLQLENIYGINVYRFTKDKKGKKKKTALIFAYAFLIVWAAFYAGGMAYGYIFMGLAELLPAYLIMLSSLVILFFSIFKAGSIIFQKNAYDILASLPITQTAIVVSRFVRMYVENMLLTFVIMLPPMAVYGIMIKPGISFYIIGILITVFIPLLPITISVFLGALITAIASRMKHKSLASTVLSIVLILGILVGSSKAAVMGDEFSIEMIQSLLGTVLGIIEDIYPPAVWLGNAMLTGDFLACVACVAGSLVLFFIMMAVVSIGYYPISRALYSGSAKHDYQMKHLKSSSVLAALYKREWKRYFSSSAYVINTIVGPIMALVFSISFIAIGEGQMQAFMNMPFDIRELVPFVLAGVFCIMPITCSAISLEGKEWWIIKSLPVKTKDLLDSKLLLNLSIILPFWLVSEVLFIIALKPGVMELLWLIVIPVIMVVFSCVFGLTVNLKMPVFDWENEVTVVKQSASAFFGGICGFLIVLACMVPTLLCPVEYDNGVKLATCVVMILVTFVLYQNNNRVNLQEL